MDNQIKNPWLGLRSYQEGEIIYGRTEEIASLAQCILSNVQTVLYGKSGIGKTSLLNAGVFPLVRKKGVFPVNIRLEHNSKPYFTQISRAVLGSLKQLRRDTIDENGNKVVIVEEGTFVERVNPIINGKETLWEFFHRYEFYDSKGEKLIPMLLFDQFEEIFTLEKDASKVKAFFSELADLLNGVIPDYICSETDDYASKAVFSDSLDNGLSFDVADYNVTPGQYEDYLTTSDFHVVFSLREDFLSYLERETVKIPSLRQNRYCLQSINEEQAAIIIMNPIPGLVSKDVAKLIISKVIGDNQFELDGIPERQVDSAILSLYLSRLYNSLPENESEITSSLVESEAENIIASFYSDSISDLPSKIVEYLEDNLINGEGRRESISVYKAKHDGHLTDKLLQTLIEDKKLLRQFDYGGGLRIEFIHDILCPIIARRKEYRFEIKEQQEIERRNQLEAQRLAGENEKLLLEKAQNRKRKTLLLVSAIGLAIIAFVIILMSINNHEKEIRLTKLDEELSETNRQVREILPLVVEQKIKEGDTYSASGLLLRLYPPDSLYIKEEPIRTSLLRKLSNSHAVTLYGHSRSVNAAKFTKDGKFVITGSDDQTLKVWDANTGHLEHSLAVNGAVSSIAVGPDNRTIVVADKSGAVETILVSRDSIVKKRSVNLSGTYARFVTFNPNGTEIITCCDNGNIIVYDANDMTIKEPQLKSPKNGIQCITYDPTGSQMILAGSDKTITIRDATNKNILVALPTKHTDWVRSVDISPDGHTLASCSDDKTVRLWDLDTYNCYWFKTLPDWVTNVRFTPDGNRIVVSSRDGVLRTFDVRTQTELTALQINHPVYISSFDLSPDGYHVVTCTSMSTVHVWDCGEQMDSGIDFRLKGSIYGISFINGSNSFAAASNKGCLGVWDYITGDTLFIKDIGKGDNGRVTSLQTSPDGCYIAVSTKFQVRLFDADTGEELGFDNKNGHTGWVRDLCFSHDGQMLASVGEDKRIILWSIPEKKVIKHINNNHSAGIYSVSFSHNDSLLVTGSADKTICQWHVSSGKQIKQAIVGHKGVVLSVIYSQDDTKILSSSSDQTACLWDVDGNIIQQYIGASGWMNDICYNYTEDEVITASSDKSIRIWCSRNGRETVKLDGHLGAIRRVILSKEGTLVSGDDLGEIKIWHIPELKSVADSLIEQFNGSL